MAITIHLAVGQMILILRDLEAYIEKRIKLEIQNAINEVAMQTAIDIVKRGGNVELSEHSESQGNRTGE